MNINHQVFTGIFADEFGQRFLMMIGEIVDNAFYDLFQSCVPANIKRLQECLGKVTYWDKSILQGECEKISFVDHENLFKQSYINYVKQLKGSNQVKISVNMPKFENFIHSFLITASTNKFLCDGRFFNCGPLEQKCVCMEIARNTLYDFLGDEYVKIEIKKPGSSVVSSQSMRKYRGNKEPTIKEELSDDDDSIAPEDSVSQLGYSYNRDRRKNDYRDDRRSDSRDDRSNIRDDRSDIRDDRNKRDDRSDIRDDRNKRDDRSNIRDDRNKRDDRYSDINDSNERRHEIDELSLSSVTLSQTRKDREPSVTHKSDTYQKDTYKNKNDEDIFSESSYRGEKRTYENEKNSSVIKSSKKPQMLHNDDDDSSSEEKEEDRRKKSPCKSYVTQLTDTSKMTSER